MFQYHLNYSVSAWTIRTIFKNIDSEHTQWFIVTSDFQNNNTIELDDYFFFFRDLSDCYFDRVVTHANPPKHLHFHTHKHTLRFRHFIVRTVDVDLFNCFILKCRRQIQKRVSLLKINKFIKSLWRS